MAYGDKIYISPNVKLNEETYEHENHDQEYTCDNSWCLRYLCECDSSIHYEPDTDACPTIQKQLNHTHPKTCRECERLILKETCDMFSKALKECENEIMKEI
jgi:hypothetical protein